jgi:hypothetical protein
MAQGTLTDVASNKTEGRMDTLTLVQGDIAQIVDEEGSAVLAIDDAGDLFEIPSGTLALVVETAHDEAAWAKVMINNRIGSVWSYECIPLKMSA